MKLLAAVIACACASGCGALSYSDSTYVRVGGVDRSVSPADMPAAEAESLRTEAGAALACGAIQSVETGNVYLVSGCGQHAVYAEVNCYVKIAGEYQSAIRFMSVSRPVIDVSRFGDVNCTDTDGRLETLRDLNLRGARDLKCSRDDVVPTLYPNGRGHEIPVAEGCGRRATYLATSVKPLRLSAVVDVTPDVTP